MAEYITNGQSNYGWSLTWDAAGRYPIVAKRRFATLADAQAFVDDISATATATEGLILSVINDTVAKNNGVYYIASVAMAEGETGKLVKVGGTETEIAKNYSEAKTLSTTLVVGQLIKVSEEETITEGEGEEAKEVTYQAGFYIVEGAGVISALATSTGSDDEVGALKGRVNALETTVGNEEAGLVKDIADLKEAVEAIEIPEVPVQNVTVNGESVLDENGVAVIDLTPYETVEEADKVRERMEAAEGAIEGLDAAVKAIVIPEVPVQNVTVDGESVLDENGVAVIDLTPYETVEEADKVRERMAAAEGAITALQTKDGELATAIDGKVAKEEGKSLVADDEIAKLATVAQGAQANVIEVVKVNGTALTVAEADKSVEITIPTAPVQGVADDEKILALDGDKLKTTLTLAYVPATETENAVLRLQGINGAVVSSIDATAFVKDGMLAGAKLEGPKEGETGERYLSLTFHVGEGTEEIRMDVSELIDYYAAGDGLVLDGKTFKVKVDETANAYLQVTTNGIAVSQAFLDKITELDNAVLTSAKGYADTKAGEAETAAKGYTDTTIAALKLDETYEKVGVAQGLINDLNLPNTYEAKGAADTALASAQGYTDTAIANLKLAETYEAKGTAQGLIDDLKLGETYEKVGVAADLLKAHEEAMVETLKGKANVDDSYLKADADAKFVAQVEGKRLMTDAEGTKLAGIEEGAQVNVIESININGIDADITGKEATLKVEADDIELGTAIKNGEEEKYAANTKISVVLQGIQDSIRGAIAGGVNSVSAGDTAISVNSADANNPTVSLNVEASTDDTVKAGHIEIVKGNDGVYGMMYYDGDDVE